MKATSQRRKRFSIAIRMVLALFIGGHLSLLCGCGTGAYSEQMDTTRRRLSLIARFDVLTKHPQVIAGAPATIRLPKEFTAVAVNGSLMTPFVPLPGSSVKAEIPLQTQNKPTPVVVYLGTIEKRTPQDTANVLAGLQARVAEKFQGTTGAWEPALGTAPKSYDTPLGGTVPWRQMTAKGEMLLGSTNEKMQCTLDLYLHEGQNSLVWLAMQKPDVAPGPASLGRDLPLTLGTVVTQPLPAWTFDEGQAEKLSEPQAIGPAKIRVPKTFSRATDATKPPPGMQMVVWKKDPKAPAALPLFSVSVAPYSDTAALGDYVNQILVMRKPLLPNISLEAAEMGTLGETIGFRQPYYGQWDNQQMRGFVYAFRNGQKVVIVEVIEYSFDAASTMVMWDAAARSITF